MFYSLRHVTRFRYSKPISENVMEVRMQPRGDGDQRLLSFDLTVEPRTRLMAYRDPLGNTVHHFNIPSQHSLTIISTSALMEVDAPSTAAPDGPAEGWDKLETLIADGDYWEMLLPSQFAHSTPLLVEFERELGVTRRDEPLAVLQQINAGIHEHFAYVPRSTRVDSPIDEALRSRQGVCQDFAHIFITMARQLRIPCRYVSGYLYHERKEPEAVVEDASHAWAEALVPGRGWTGFDPTNNTLAGERHIRVAIGRDYADVPPTRGVFKGDAASELSVTVKVAQSPQLLREEVPLSSSAWISAPAVDRTGEAYQHQQQQQQQQ